MALILPEENKGHLLTTTGLERLVDSALACEPLCCIARIVLQGTIYATANDRPFGAICQAY